MPTLKGALGPTPLQLHTHCLTGLGPLCALEAIQAGVNTVHTATSPLAHGASQPPTEWVALNARRLGFEVTLDVDGLEPVARHLRSVAARTTETVIAAMGAALDLITPTDISGWFQDRAAYAFH